MIWHTIFHRLSGIELQLIRIESQLDALLKQEANMAIDLTAATAEMAKNNDVTASAVLAINTMLANLAAVPPSTDPVTQAALDNIVANWKANDSTIAAAVAKTPQNPVVVPPVVVVPPAAPAA